MPEKKIRKYEKTVCINNFLCSCVKYIIKKTFLKRLYDNVPNKNKKRILKKIHPDIWRGILGCLVFQTWTGSEKRLVEWEFAGLLWCWKPGGFFVP